VEAANEAMVRVMVMALKIAVTYDTDGYGREQHIEFR
jgi:hypothetical protein